MALGGGGCASGVMIRNHSRHFQGFCGPEVRFSRLIASTAIMFNGVLYHATNVLGMAASAGEILQHYATALPR